ncbi:MAG: group II intron reverse transcriptase/maturase [Propionicimonas sp.]
MDENKSSGKSFDISKVEVWLAWEAVKANKGAPGVDGCSLEEFEKDLKNNLYKIWNRMSAGSYFPPPVRAVEIPKKHAGVRVLGVPTVGDRIAQTVVARRIEARVEPMFHPDSYGYRPGRSAIDAVGTCKRRCWRYDWVIDMDIQSFFDHVDHELMVKAVEANTDLPWVVLYVKRWLTAPLALPDGTLRVRERGTPQGSAASPVLANLFLHYAFDAWMAREYPGVPFERYVDDAVVHCVTKAQAERLTAAIRDRLAGVGLTLHPTKTRIVYCKDQRRDRAYEYTSFDFLGFTFRARGARRKDGTCFTSFMPAVSKDALKRMSEQVRSWRLHRRTGHNLTELAARINPIIRGWMNYYGSFYRSALYGLWSRINGYLLRWIRHKYDRLRPFTKAKAAWKRITTASPAMLAHWQWCRMAW